MQSRKELVKRSFRSLTLLFGKHTESKHSLIANKQFSVLLGVIVEFGIRKYNNIAQPDPFPAVFLALWQKHSYLYWRSTAFALSIMVLF